MCDATVERMAHQFARRVETIDIAKVVPQAERDSGQLQAAAPTAAIRHGVVAGGGGNIVHDLDCARRRRPSATDQSTPAPADAWQTQTVAASPPGER